jgi:hypothetical protein
MGTLTLSVGALSLVVFGGLVFLAGGWLSPKIRPGLFDAVNRSAKAIEASARIGVDSGKFRGLLQEFSTQLELLGAEVRTPEEKSVHIDYREMLSIYRDSLSILEMEEYRPSLIDELTRVINIISNHVQLNIQLNMPALSVHTPTREELARREALQADCVVLIGWLDSLTKGWIPAFQVGVADTEGVGAFGMSPTGLLVSVPDRIKYIDSKLIANKYKMNTFDLNGYAFVKPQGVETLWDSAKKKASQAREHADSEG